VGLWRLQCNPAAHACGFEVFWGFECTARCWSPSAMSVYLYIIDPCVTLCFLTTHTIHAHHPSPAWSVLCHVFVPAASSSHCQLRAHLFYKAHLCEKQAGCRGPAVRSVRGGVVTCQHCRVCLTSCAVFVSVCNLSSVTCHHCCCAERLYVDCREAWCW
jgi:hypothetical protein